MYNIAIPNMLNGVSQQPPQVRFPTQCEELINGHSSPSESLTKRYPTDFVYDWSVGEDLKTAPSGKMFIVDRGDGAEAYGLFIKGSGFVKAWDLRNDTEIPVQLGATTPDFTYLDITDPQKAESALSMTTIGDFTLVANQEKTVAMDTAFVEPSDLQALLWVRAVGYGSTFDIRLELQDDDGTAVVSRDVFFRAPNLDDTEYFFPESTTKAGYLAVNSSDSYPDAADWGSPAPPQAGGTFDTFGNDTAILDHRFIALLLYDALYPDPRLVVNGSGDIGDGMPAVTGLTIKQQGNTVVLDLDLSAAQAAYGNSITRMRVFVKDSLGNNGIIPVSYAVPSFDRLPLQAPDGFVVKIEGLEDEERDDYWVRFDGFSSSSSQATVEGVWTETAEPESRNKFDFSTMPHAFIRKFFTAQDTIPAGSSIGDPYFAFTRLDGLEAANNEEWKARNAGDEVTNPVPSFVGSTIDGIFTTQGRLGFVSGEAVCLSEVGRFFNFFRTTVISLVDSDRIDVLSAYPEVTKFRHGVPLGNKLILFSNKAQLALSSPDTELLTPRTVTLDSVSQYECVSECRPALVDQEVFFPFLRGQTYTGVRDMILNIQDASLVSAPEVTAHVPRYILGTPEIMRASPFERVLAVLTKDSDTKLYIYKWYDSQNQRVQSSWSQWDYPAVQIVSIGWLESDLILFVRNAITGDYGIRRSQIRDNRLDPNSPICVRLDNRQKFTNYGNTVSVAGLSSLADPVCSNLQVSASPLSFPSAGSGGSVTANVTMDGECDWNASSSESWVSLTNPSGTGNGTFSFDVSSNGSNDTRTAAITVSSEAGLVTLTILQQGQVITCDAVGVSPSGLEFVAEEASSQTVNVTTVDNSCGWTATSSDSWLVVSGGVGSGNSSFTVSVSDNTTTSPRSGSVTVALDSGLASETVSVTQQGIEAPPLVPLHLLPECNLDGSPVQPVSEGSGFLFSGGNPGNPTNPVIPPNLTIAPGASYLFPEVRLTSEIEFGSRGTDFEWSSIFNGPSDQYGYDPYLFMLKPNVTVRFDTYFRASREYTAYTTPNPIDAFDITIEVFGEGAGTRTVTESEFDYSTVAGTGQYGDFANGNLIWTDVIESAPKQVQVGGFLLEVTFRYRGAWQHNPFPVNNQTDFSNINDPAVGFDGYVEVKVVEGPSTESSYLRVTHKSYNVLGFPASDTTLDPLFGQGHGFSVTATYTNSTKSPVTLNPQSSFLPLSSGEDFEEQYPTRVVYAEGPNAGSTVREESRQYNPSTGLIDIQIDADGTPVYFGHDYQFFYRFSQPYLRVGDGPALGSGRFQIKNINVLYDDSGPFRAEVSPVNSLVFQSYVYDRGPTVNTSFVNSPIESGTMRIPVMGTSEQFNIDLINDTPYPSKFTSAEIEASNSGRYRRI